MKEMPQPLEQSLDRVLRTQPPLRAPVSLESRVLAEIERRAALPWWQRSFVYWPMGVRFAVLLATVAAAIVAGLAVDWTGDSLVASQTASESLGWLHSAGDVLAAIAGLGSYLFDLIPAHWLQLLVAVGALGYAVLFGLGIVSYRVLYK